MKIKDQVKRLFFSAVCLAVLFGALSGASPRAEALGGSVASAEELAEVLGGSGYADVVGSPDGEVVQLLQDVYLIMDTVTVMGGEVMLDLNGCGIYAETTAFVIEEGASLDVMDTAGNGIVGGYSDDGTGTFMNYGSLTLHSGTYVADGLQCFVVLNMGELLVHDCEMYSQWMCVAVDGGHAVLKNGWYYTVGFAPIAIEDGRLEVYNGVYEGYLFGLYGSNTYASESMEIYIGGGSFQGTGQAGAAIVCLEGTESSVVIDDGIFIGNDAGILIDNETHSALIRGGQFSCNGETGYGGILSFLGESETDSLEVKGMHISEIIAPDSYMDPPATEVIVEKGEGINTFVDVTEPIVFVTPDSGAWGDMDHALSEINALSIEPLVLGDGDQLEQCEAYAFECVAQKLEEIGYSADSFGGMSIVFIDYVAPDPLEGNGEFGFCVVFGDGGCSELLRFELSEPSLPWEDGGDITVIFPPEEGENEWFPGGFELPEGLQGFSPEGQDGLRLIACCAVVLAILVFWGISILLCVGIVLVIVLRRRKNRK